MQNNSMKNRKFHVSGPVFSTQSHKNVVSSPSTMSGASFQNSVNISFPVIVTGSEGCWRWCTSCSRTEKVETSDH